MARLRRANLVSFSGIDGAGKSTQITALTRYLGEQGQDFEVLQFWDDVAAWSRLRERMSLRVFKGDSGVGSLDRPIRRRDKDVSFPFLHLVRLIFYTLDAWKLRRIVGKSDAGKTLIFDRYLYDELANLPLQNQIVRGYIRFLLTVVPKPDVPVLLDADPESATARKPEYPLEFVHRNRNAYLTLASVAGMNVIPASTADDVFARIQKLFSLRCRPSDRAHRDFHLDPSVATADGNSANE